LKTKGDADEGLPGERAMRDILNRMGDRLKRITKGKPPKKTKETDAACADVQQVREQARTEPAPLAISMDAKAEVAPGADGRGGKDPDRRRR
jgi:hypothetical protein